jgi:hypothetical protein
VVVKEGKNGQFSEDHFVAGLGVWLAMAALISPKMAVFSFRDQKVAAMAAMASFFDIDNPRS